MRRFVVLIVVLAAIAAACGGTAATTTTGGGAAQSGTDPGTSDSPVLATPTESQAPGTTGSGDTPPATEAPPTTPSFDGPPAPDFELALETGGAVKLSDEAKPVYMVFWAEW